MADPVLSMIDSLKMCNMLSHKKEKIEIIGRKCEALESVGPIIELTQFSFSVVINIIQCDECLNILMN